MVLNFARLTFFIFIMTGLSACTTDGSSSGFSSEEYKTAYEEKLTEFAETKDALLQCSAARIIGDPDAGVLGTKSFRKKKYIEHITKSIELSPEQGLNGKTNACYLILIMGLQNPRTIIKPNPEMIACMAENHGFYEDFTADDFHRCAAELNYEP